MLIKANLMAVSGNLIGIMMITAGVFSAAAESIRVKRCLKSLLTSGKAVMYQVSV